MASCSEEAQIRSTNLEHRCTLINGASMYSDQWNIDVLGSMEHRCTRINGASMYSDQWSIDVL